MHIFSWCSSDMEKIQLLSKEKLLLQVTLCAIKITGTAKYIFPHQDIDCKPNKITLINKEHAYLMLSTLGKIFSRPHLEIFFSYFSQKTGSVISCKLSPMQTICLQWQILFYGKNQKNIPNLSSAEFAQRVVKVKQTYKKAETLAGFRESTLE